MPAPCLSRRKWYDPRSRSQILSTRTRLARAAIRNRKVPPATTVVTVTQPHYRRAADTLIEAPDGTVQIWNGIDKPQRFDAATALIENVGVAAPINPVQMVGSGSGPIVGTFFAYLRFVDRNGNFSSLSPISPVFVPNTLSCTITGASNASPIVLTTTTNNLGSGQIIKVSGVMGNQAANGVWLTGAVTPTSVTLLNGDGSASVANGVYNSGGAVYTGVQYIAYGNLQSPTESKVVRRQILRNKDGETTVFYIDIDTTDLTSSVLFSSTTSLSLAGPVALADVDGNTLVDKSVPIVGKKLAAVYNGRVFSAGNEPYTEGSVSVTNGSNIVNGAGVEWGQLTFPGRYLEVVGGDKRYTIQYLPTTSQLVLTAPYAGATDPYAYYQIYNGPSERRKIYWSEPAQPEAWPITDGLAMAEDPLAGEITGMMPLHTWVYIMCENRVYRFFYVSNPLSDGYVTTAAKRGCVNNKCWVTVEDTAYMMDYNGFHAFAGNDDQDISTPQVQDLFRQKQTNNIYRINWAAKRNFHAVYDPGEATIRWFVCLAGSYAPYHAICYQVRLRHWWIEEYPFPIGSSCLGRLNGRPQVYLGTDSRRIMAFHKSTLDAVDPGIATVQGTVTSSGYDWIADSSAIYQSELAGQPVVITQGAGKHQLRRIVSVVGTTLNLDRPWNIRPDTTSKYQLGGIRWKWKSGWLRWQESDDESRRGVTLQFKPTTQPAMLYLKLFGDMSTTSKNDWGSPSTLADSNGVCYLANDPTSDLSFDSTKASGFIQERLPAFREFYTDAQRYVAWELGGVTNADQQSIFSISFEGMVQ